nr:zinc finger protein CONSTANS-LIKE 4-like [Ipomoea trifida]
MVSSCGGEEDAMVEGRRGLMRCGRQRSHCGGERQSSCCGGGRRGSCYWWWMAEGYYDDDGRGAVMVADFYALVADLHKSTLFKITPLAVAEGRASRSQQARNQRLQHPRSQQDDLQKSIHAASRLPSPRDKLHAAKRLATSDSKTHATNKMTCRNQSRSGSKIPWSLRAGPDKLDLQVQRRRPLRHLRGCDRDFHSAKPLVHRHEPLPVVPFYNSAADAKSHGCRSESQI